MLLRATKEMDGSSHGLYEESFVDLLDSGKGEVGFLAVLKYRLKVGHYCSHPGGEGRTFRVSPLQGWCVWGGGRGGGQVNILESSR